MTKYVFSLFNLGIGIILNKYKIFRQIVITIFFTFFVHYFYSLEIIRSNIEDLAFDRINEFVLSIKEEKLNAPNLILFKIDDNYLKAKELLDKNNELKYRYLFPRSYIAQFIKNLDEYLEYEIKDKNKLPRALFIDYDMSFYSNFNSLKPSLEDQLLIDILKKDRAYIIYLSKTSNNNFIESSKDSVIQKKIKDKQIVFVSLGLSVSNDDITRRYYSYKEFFKEGNTKKIVYPLINIEIFNQYKNNKQNVKNEFSIGDKSLIENRIVYKEYKQFELSEDIPYQESYWENFRTYSASYDLYNITEEVFHNSIIYLGGTHSKSDDTFTKDMYDREMSGIEIHANTLMTLFYFDGKLEKLNLFLSIFLISIVLILSHFTLDVLIKILKTLKRILSFCIKKITIFKENHYFEDKNNDFESFRDKAFIFVVLILLFALSAYILINFKVWFNWLVPSLMTLTFPYLGKFAFWDKIENYVFKLFIKDSKGKE